MMRLVSRPPVLNEAGHEGPILNEFCKVQIAQSSPMEPKLIAWLICTLLSVIALAKLMRGRQTKLMLALRSYVEAQLEWSRKKAQTARLTKKVSQKKAIEESHLKDTSKAA